MKRYKSPFKESKKKPLKEGLDAARGLMEYSIAMKNLSMILASVERFEEEVSGSFDISSGTQGHVQPIPVNGEAGGYFVEIVVYDKIETTNLISFLKEKNHNWRHLKLKVSPESIKILVQMGY